MRPQLVSSFRGSAWLCVVGLVRKAPRAVFHPPVRVTIKREPASFEENFRFHDPTRPSEQVWQRLRCASSTNGQPGSSVTNVTHQDLQTAQITLPYCCGSICRSPTKPIKHANNKYLCKRPLWIAQCQPTDLQRLLEYISPEICASDTERWGGGWEMSPDAAQLPPKGIKLMLLFKGHPGSRLAAVGLTGALTPTQDKRLTLLSFTGAGKSSISRLLARCAPRQRFSSCNFQYGAVLELPLDCPGR